MRKPIGRDDGSIGYIFESSIDSVELHGGTPCVHLKDGQKIDILDSVKTARNRIIMGRHIKDNMLDMDICGLTFNEIGSIYNKSATKRDIFLLLCHLLTTKDDNSI